MNSEPDLPVDALSDPGIGAGAADRYARQILFQPIGVEGQRRLGQARVALVGCGALGSVLASILVRAGVGQMRIVDRDFIELDNLQRQMLFDEQDVADDLPKAEAAARKLRRINRTVTIEPVVADFQPGSAEALCRDADVILDGTDNLETRFLLNDVAVKLGRPWVYGACVGAEGRVLPIVPRDTPCLRCLWDELPPPGVLPTCETVGVIAPIVGIVASWQAVEALKLLMGRRQDLNRKLMIIDAWTGRVRQVDVQAAYAAGNCRCCKQGHFDFLSGGQASAAATLCGRDAVQISPAGAGTARSATARVDLRAIAEHLAAYGACCNEYLLRVRVERYELTLFPDGRAIIKGTSDPALARSLYARYIGA